MKRKVRYAVVGLGHIAQVAVLPAFRHARESSELVAFVSDNEDKLNELGERYNIEALYQYEQLERCIKDERIDAVYIAVPNALHLEYVLRAVQAGAHVLCEKPLGITANECERMIEAAAQNGMQLMTAYRLHFDEANMEAVRLCTNGAIGEPQLFSSIFSYQIKEENIRLEQELGGGALFDIGIYCINAARYIFRAEPVSVTAISFKGKDGRFNEVDGITSALLEFPNNRIAQFSCSFAAAAESSFEVVGEKGRLRLESAYEYVEDMTLFTTVGEKTTRKKFKRHDQFAAELAYFSSCIERGKEPEPSGWEGLADVRIIEALQESALTGSRVELSGFEKQFRPMKSQVYKFPPVLEKPALTHVESAHRD